MKCIMRYFFFSFLLLFWGSLLFVFIHSLNDVKITIAVEQVGSQTPAKEPGKQPEETKLVAQPFLPILEKPRWDLGLAKDPRHTFAKEQEIPVIEDQKSVQDASFQDRVQMILDNHLIPILLKIAPDDCRACTVKERRMLLQIKMADAFRRGDTKLAKKYLQELSD